MGKTKASYTSHEVEKFSDTIKSSAGTAKKQLDGFVPDFFEQLMGFNIGNGSEHAGGERSADKPLVVQDPVTGAIELFNASSNQTKHETKRGHHESAPKAEKHKEAAIDHAGEIRTSSERASKAETREVNQRLEQIMVELRRLVSSSKMLQMEFADVNVDQAPTQAGEYHLNFFDWLLLTIRTAREKVENSGAWLATAKNKSGKKGGYWGMFKKHGTSFGLSNERGVATQTG